MLRKLPKIVSVTMALALAACASPDPSDGTGQVRPEPRVEAALQIPPKGPSLESQQDATYYRSIQNSFVAAGRLRRDPNPADAWFGPKELVRNFTNIALYDEYRQQDGAFVHSTTPSHLRRWQRPIRISLHFGESVSPEQRRKDTKQVHYFANRLERLSGLDIEITKGANGNFAMLFLNRDEQKQLGESLGGKVSNLLPEIVTEIETSPRQVYCAAYTLSSSDPARGYSGAVLLIKAEQPDLLRLSCIQEEMAQALGLANDDPRARPSIFNDDEEFALLTTHDEMLIRMLYDPRLKLGMTAETALPILPQVAEEIYGHGLSG